MKPIAVNSISTIGASILENCEHGASQPTCRAMDPLSLTASIIAILELTTTLTGYIHDVRHATREGAKVAVEASNLYGLLTSLRSRVEEARSADPWLNQVKLLGVENGPLDQFKDVLEKMVEQISSSRKRDQVIDVEVHQIRGGECIEADRAVEVTDPVCVDRGRVVGTTSA
jgi:hypothetical protein